jgi:hypothetical protein
MKKSALLLLLFSGQIFADVLTFNNSCTSDLNFLNVYNSASDYRRPSWHEDLLPLYRANYKKPPSTFTYDTKERSQKGDKITVAIAGTSGPNLSCDMTANAGSHTIEIVSSGNWIYYKCKINSCK